MERLVDLVKLARLDCLIRREATGSPEDLAERLNMSQSNLFELIQFLKKEMKAPIIYNMNKVSYIYLYITKFHLGFEREDSITAYLNNSYNGIAKNEKREENRKHNYKVENDDYEFFLEDNIDFNELYY